jgi:RNA ligase
MQLRDAVDTEELDALIKSEHITRKKHPTLPLSIYTYTHLTSGLNVWNETTIRCRGLVVDDESGEIVAWPFPKFFQYGQHLSDRCAYARPLPDEPFEVFEKLDGSLAIIFHYKGRWIAASKSSFISDHAQWAQKKIDEETAGDEELPPVCPLKPGCTYVAEIIHPTNRIVVDYGERDDLVLLAVFDEAGRELALDAQMRMSWNGIGSMAEVYDVGLYPHDSPAQSLKDLAQLADWGVDRDGRHVRGSDREGFVVRLQSGVRVKIKYSDYLRLHKIMTGISERDIWRALVIQLHPWETEKTLGLALYCSEEFVRETREGGGKAKSMTQILEAVPDEFYNWVHSVCGEMVAKHAAMSQALELAHLTLMDHWLDRKAYAQGAASWHPTVRSGMMLLLDGKLTSLFVWRQLMPAATAPFREDEEN